MVNGMEAFGRSNQLGADGACWKGNGITSVNGDLYLSVSRHWYHVKPYDHRQISRDASILRSTDKGKTWSSTPYNAEPLPDPLFPEPRYAVSKTRRVGVLLRRSRRRPDLADGQTGVNYIHSLERCVLIGWHYPKLDRETWNHSECVWDLYESPAPWGPWNHVDSVTWNPLGLYNPVIPSKFVAADGRHKWVLACGDFDTWNLPPEEQLYTLHQVPLTLS